MAKSGILTILVLLLALPLTQPAVAQDAAPVSEQRVQQLEEKLNAQQRIIDELLAEIRQVKAQTQPASTARPGDDPETARLRQAAAEERKAAFDALPDRVNKLEKDNAKRESQLGKLSDGLKFSSGDGTWDGYVGGRVRMHMRNFVDRPSDGTRTSPDTFFLREIRLETGGTYKQDWEYKVQYDMPTGSSSTTGTLQDGYLGWKHYPVASLRMGQFKEPFSQEESTSGRFIDFNERSVLTRLAPGRDIGFMAYGKALEDIVEYEVGVFNGQGRAVFDGGDNKEFAARLRINPFLTSDIPWLKGLRVGAAGTVGAIDDASIDGLDFRTTELGVLFLDSSVGTINGLRNRMGVEMSWLYDSFSVRGEWVKKTDWVSRVAGNVSVQVEQDAWYVAATWLPTGEKKTLENRITPLKPFSISDGTWGAVELAFRVADLEIEDSIFDYGLASRTGQANEVMTYTGGVNWWLTKNIRISSNYIVEQFNAPLNFGTPPPGGRGMREDTATGFLTRFQIDF